MILQTDGAIELRRQTMQVELDSTRSGAERNRLGQFATPPGLAQDIVRCLAALLPGDAFPVLLADPSVGSGSFFSAALSVFGQENIAGATGIEIDNAFCQAAHKLWAPAGLTIVCGDFTRIISGPDCPAAPNVILANPPYVRHHHIDRQEKQRLQSLIFQRLNVRVSGLAGLYVYFLLLAASWMQDGGYAAWLVPSEFMDVNYGMALKNFLAHSLKLLRVHRFDPRDSQFDDAMVSSAVLIFKKIPPAAGHSVIFTLGGSLERPALTQTISQSSLLNSEKWTAYPQPPGNKRIAHGGSAVTTLGDLFKITRGIATGGNKFFVLERREAHKRGIPDQFLRPILPSPRQLQSAVVEAQDDGYPRLSRQWCLLNCNVSEALIESRYPALWAYLSSAESIEIKQGYLVGKRTPWYAQERRDAAPFLCTYMGRGNDEKRPFRFIWNQSQAIATNLYLMLYPRHCMAALLRQRPELAAVVFKILGDITGHELRSRGRVYGDGLYKIEPKELGRISGDVFIQQWPELAAGVEQQASLSLLF